MYKFFMFLILFVCAAFPQTAQARIIDGEFLHTGHADILVVSRKFAVLPFFSPAMAYYIHNIDYNFIGKEDF